MIDAREYEVLEHEKFTGLTIGSRVSKPGSRFRHNEWRWGDESLEVAIKLKRCKMVAGFDKDEAVKSQKIEAEKEAVKSKESEKEKEIEKKKVKLEKMQEKYSEMDSDDPKAVKLLDKIKELEEEIDHDS